MNILVCISKVPDTTTKIAFTDGDTKFDESNVQWIVNPYDEWYALVRALEITEQNGGKVTIINVGPAANDPVIRKALAIGAHEAVRVDAEATEAYFVAKQIAEYAKDKGFDMIWTGKETIDYNGAEVGGMIAELLNLPYVSHASDLQVEGSKSTLKRAVEGGYEVVEIEGPFVGSAQKGMSEARIPNMRGIMAARTKPLNVVPAVDAEQLTSVKVYGLPEEKGDCTYVDAENPEKLVELLHSDAKVI